ncbi:Uncharacterised protein [Bordetella pertussis]|nr:Uncharacterised protein [Bordetella pertussis]CPO04948.1 Uncharacterised protein [Bordetella pertussis]
MRGRFVDQRQGVTVAGDLLFGAALWCCVADDQRLQPRRRYDNTFQPVGRLGGLHHRDLAQALKGFGRLCGVELLLTLVLAQCAQRGDLSAIEAKRGKVLGCERVHENVNPGCVNGVIIAFKWGIVSRNTSLAVFDYPISWTLDRSRGVGMADQGGNGRHESKKRGNKSKLPYLFHCLPHSRAHPSAKERERHSRDNGPILKRIRPFYPLRCCDTRPNRPYAAPLSSAAFRYSAQSCNSVLL